MGANPAAAGSAAGLPRAVALYGPLPEQLSRPDSFASQLKATAKPQDPIARVMLSIQKDCSLPYSQSNLAEGLGLSPAYFSRLFEKRAGVRFSTYLTSARIAHAQELLRHGATLAEVTQACGYQRKSYFCEVFRKQTGMTALTYRAMLRKDDRR